MSRFVLVPSRRPSPRAAGGSLALLAVLLVPSPAPAGPPAHVVLRSPLPGARWVRPETGLLLRFDPPLDASPGAPPTITATGTRSGPHSGRTIVADGGRALIFRPDVPFAYDEHVTVSVSDPTGAGGFAVPPYEFSTSLRPAAIPAAALLPESMLEDPAARAFARASLSPAGTPHATLDAAPFALPAPVQRTLDGSATGYFFSAPLTFDGSKAPSLLIQDGSNQILYYRQMPNLCFDFKMQPDGRMTYYDSQPGLFVALDRSYTPVDSFYCGNGYTTDVHELRILPDGHALLLGLDPQVIDMSQVVAGGKPAATVLGNVVQELDADKNVVFEWRSFDHFQITDATHEDLTASVIDDVHANALELDNDGNILLSSRHLDEITKIDHTTGDIVWRLGGKNNQFTLVGDTLWFSHQHAIRRIDNGHITLFDNGNFHPTPFSRGVEYDLDEVGKTATLVWQFDNVPPSYGFAMGYVERLDDGSTLISYGTGDPDALQVASDGTVLKSIDLGAALMSYRILRQAFASVSGVAPAHGAPATLSEALPNPFAGEASVLLTLAHATPVTLQVFDVRGRKVLDVLRGETRGAGSYRVPLNLAARPAGVYFARLITDAGTVSRRLVHVR